MSSYRAFSSCEVWQSENFEPGEEDFLYSRKPEFLIEIFASFTREEDYPLVPRSTLHFHKFKEQCHLLTESRTSWSLISNMLTQILVPYHVQPFMIHTISTRAREIASEPENRNRNTIPILVSLTVGHEPFLEDQDEPEISDHVLQLVRARKSAIDELEKVKVEGCAKPCVICLEEIVNGSEATRMPCFHVYHESCIVNWLEKSHLCPLCRFEMPVEFS
ncbi:E3 ubiquitin-protein ligase RNF181-like [Prunus avium]|uniref:RING-type E3 ubiquitin transferase n=1 Tax=Prunus avium TaxID=42229 RepID=A0A6P5S4I9_PRUAV|nr:E3 ubiquitin-protein ligase RNF181-like [Prunus avium]